MSESTGYTVKRSATDSAPAPAPVDEVSEEELEATARRKPRHPWMSGWCSSGKKPHVCGDGRTVTKAGEPVRRCLYVGENGAKVRPRLLYCACDCHTDPQRAGQAVDAVGG